MKADENGLNEILLQNQILTQIEPHIYSVFDTNKTENSFDDLANFYDLVICNRLYNRIMWNYSISDYIPFTEKALRSAKNGWILDAGCGSLAFNAKVYTQYTERPIILFDHSFNLLKLAKSRLIKIHGRIPENVIFLQGDALTLPFKSQSIQTLISLNLLHVFENLEVVLNEFKRVTVEDADMSFTTLIATERLADKYLEIALKKACGVRPRKISDLQSAFSNLELPTKYRVQGNMAFIS